MRKQQLKRKNGEGKAAKRKLPSEKTGGSAWLAMVQGKVKEQFGRLDMKKLLIRNFPYFIIFYLVEKEAWLYRYCTGDSMVKKLMNLFLNFSLAFQNPFPSLHLQDITVGLIGASAFRLAVYFKGKNAKKFRQGEEYGSARWGTAKDIEPFIDPVFENNVLLTQTERLTMNSRPKHPKYARNKNVIVIGGSGSGKTRFYVKPSAPVRAV